MDVAEDARRRASVVQLLRDRTGSAMAAVRRIMPQHKERLVSITQPRGGCQRVLQAAESKSETSPHAGVGFVVTRDWRTARAREYGSTV